VEPDRKTILSSLIPKSLRSKIYSIILDSAAAEQAARMVAMQIATDNADDILGELTIQYNKQRQQSITSELLDIIGGAEALK
jgi:F-type H+-transporting ATPase subunit gamma